MNDIYFDDNEKERMDAFDVGIVGGQPRATLVINGDVRSGPPNKYFITQEMDRKYIIEEDYMTDELDSVVDDELCDDMPSVIRFNEEYAFSKDLTFKFGMKFSSLK